MMGVAISIAAVIGLLPELAAINTCREERSYIVINRPKEEEGQFINKFVFMWLFFLLRHQSLVNFHKQKNLESNI